MTDCAWLSICCAFGFGRVPQPQLASGALPAASASRCHRRRPRCLCSGRAWCPSAIGWDHNAEREERLWLSYCLYLRSGPEGVRTRECQDHRASEPDGVHAQHGFQDLVLAQPCSTHQLTSSAGPPPAHHHPISPFTTNPASQQPLSTPYLRHHRLAPRRYPSAYPRPQAVPIPPAAYH